MSDAIWAIFSNSMGHPYTGSGRIGHIVVATDDPHIPVYLELNDGGHYPGYDCAVASSRSCLAHAGLPVPDAITVEVDESTAPPEGTFLQNIPPALRALGLPCGDPVAGLPPGSWIMNPMFGMDPRTSAYDNASQGWYIPIGAVPLSNTQTTGGTAAQEDDVQLSISSQRPGVPDAADSFWYDPSTAHVYHALEQHGQRLAQPEDLGQPPGQWLDFSSQEVFYTGGPPPAYAACRVLVKTSSQGEREFECAVPFAGDAGWHPQWTLIG